MNKALEEKMAAFIQERCRELLKQPQNSAFDTDSFITGYTYGMLFSHYIWGQQRPNKKKRYGATRSADKKIT